MYRLIHIYCSDLSNVDISQLWQRHVMGDMSALK